MIINAKINLFSKKNKVISETTDLFGQTHLQIDIKEKPENGKANTAIINTISKHYGVKVADVKIIQGKFSSNKVICIKEK